MIKLDRKCDARTRLVLAERGEPQLVTRRGVPAVVVLSADEYARLKALEEQHAPSFVDQLLAMPQDGEDFDQLQVALRDVVL
jgi:antitoxin Phd